MKFEEEFNFTGNSLCGRVTIPIYKTKKVNPTFTFEEGVIKIGELYLDIDKGYSDIKDRKIKTIIKFGGTFIDVTAIHVQSGKSVKATLIFD